MTEEKFHKENKEGDIVTISIGNRELDIEITSIYDETSSSFRGKSLNILTGEVTYQRYSIRNIVETDIIKISAVDFYLDRLKKLGFPENKDNGLITKEDATAIINGEEVWYD